MAYSGRQMQRSKAYRAARLAVMALIAGCNRRAPESRVKSLEARIDGLTCPTCVPPLTKSLTREYRQSAIEVDDDKDTATIKFDARDTFAPAAFRAAVERVRMHVVTVRAQ